MKKPKKALKKAQAPTYYQSIPEVSEITHIPQRTLRKYCVEFGLAQIAGRWMIPRGQVYRMVELWKGRENPFRLKVHQRLSFTPKKPSQSS